MTGLLLILSLCGDPYYVVIQDAQGYAAGTFLGAPESVVGRIKALLNSEAALLQELPLDSVTGLRCV